MKAYGSVARPPMDVDPRGGMNAPTPSWLTSVGGTATAVAAIPQASHKRCDRALANDAAEDRGPAREALHVLIVDDCTLYRDNLASVLAEHGATVCVAWDLMSLMSALRGGHSAFVLLNLATRDSAALLEAATTLDAGARVIALGVSEEDEQMIVACAEAGVAGYHTRSETLAELLTIMDKIAAGEIHCSPKVSAVLLRRLSELASERDIDTKDIVLTAREAQVLEMLKMGLSNRDIADELSIALHTVKNHVHSVLTKLGVQTRAQAVAVSHAVRPMAAKPRI